MADPSCPLVRLPLEHHVERRLGFVDVYVSVDWMRAVVKHRGRLDSMAEGGI